MNVSRMCILSHQLNWAPNPTVGQSIRADNDRGRVGWKTLGTEMFGIIEYYPVNEAPIGVTEGLMIEGDCLLFRRIQGGDGGV